jgi:hypothetical protein
MVLVFLIGRESLGTDMIVHFGESGAKCGGEAFDFADSPNM